jgi:hypothetical protein
MQVVEKTRVRFTAGSDALSWGVMLERQSNEQDSRVASMGNWVSLD